jgi:hypothetical protein
MRSSARTRALRLAASVLIATSAAAAPPSIRYSWNECDPLVLDRDFTGPAHFSQTLSVTGLTQPLTSFRVEIVVAAGQPSAWQFYSFGCQGAGRLTATSAAVGCLAVPGATVVATMIPGVTDFRFYLTITGTAPAGAAPDPAARYTLARLDFDHTHTTDAAFDPPGQCGGGGAIQCFGIQSVTVNGASQGGVDYVLENGTLTWNNASTPGQCPFPVRTRTSTWGMLKTLYR